MNNDVLDIKSDLTPRDIISSPWLLEHSRNIVGISYGCLSLTCKVSKVSNKDIYLKPLLIGGSLPLFSYSAAQLLKKKLEVSRDQTRIFLAGSGNADHYITTIAQYLKPY